VFSRRGANAKRLFNRPPEALARRFPAAATPGLKVEFRRIGVTRCGVRRDGRRVDSATDPTWVFGRAKSGFVFGVTGGDIRGFFRPRVTPFPVPIFRAPVSAAADLTKKFAQRRPLARTAISTRARWLTEKIRADGRCDAPGADPVVFRE